MIATGYLRTARDQTHEPESNIPLSYYGVLHDTVEMVGSSLFGLTVNCARCHSHKFDPIPQRDYYRLMALFTPAYNPRHWKPVYPWKPEIKDRAIPDVSLAEEAEIERANQAVDARRDPDAKPHGPAGLHAQPKKQLAKADCRAAWPPGGTSDGFKPSTTSARPRSHTSSIVDSSRRRDPKSNPAS